MYKRLTGMIAALVCLMLVAAACGSSGSTASSPDSAGSVSSGGGAATAQGLTPALNQWAVTYTDGKSGAADTSQTPITVGYVNQDALLPASTVGANAAVKYINAQLGGIQGHPLKLESCAVTSAEDGQRCGQEFANNDQISFVIQGAMVVGNQSLQNTLGGKKPILIANATVPADYEAKDGYSFTPGTPGVSAGMADFVAKRLPNVKKVAVIHSTNAAAEAGFNDILKPDLNHFGITDVTDAGIPDTAGTSQLTAALQAAKAGQADAIIAFLTTQGCIALYDGMKSLGITTPVVGLGFCFAQPMTQHLKDLGSSDQVPNGWYFQDYGYSYFIPNMESGMNTYLAAVKEYAPAGSNYTGLTGPTFAAVMTAAKFMNQLGVKDITPANMRMKMKNFTGPMMLVAGAIKCGAKAQYPALCTTAIGIEQYKDGKWIATALGDNAIKPFNS